MKKTIILLILFVLVSILLTLLYKIETPPKETNNEPKTTHKIDPDEDIIITKNDDYFTSYYLNFDDNYNAFLDKLNIVLENNTLKLDNKKIIDDIKLINRVAKYEDLLVLPYQYLNQFNGGLIIYDVKTKKAKIIDIIDNKYLDINEYLIMEKVGLSFNLSIVDGNNIYIKGNKKDICKIGKAYDLIVEEKITYIYDMNKHAFNDYEINNTLDYESYIKTNHLCQ